MVDINLLYTKYYLQNDIDILLCHLRLKQRYLEVLIFFQNLDMEPLLRKTVLLNLMRLKQQFHPWIKPMKKTPNKSLQTLMDIYPNTKQSDLETLDKLITDSELEQLLEDHGKQS